MSELGKVSGDLMADFGGEQVRKLKQIYDKMAEEGGGTWATYMLMEIKEFVDFSLRSEPSEPVAWQHRGKRHGDTDFGGWREGRNQSYDTADGDEFEERPLYASAKAGEAK